jgi:hypothetical protein
MYRCVRNYYTVYIIETTKVQSSITSPHNLAEELLACYSVCHDSMVVEKAYLGVSLSLKDRWSKRRHTTSGLLWMIASTSSLMWLSLNHDASRVTQSGEKIWFRTAYEGSHFKYKHISDYRCYHMPHDSVICVMHNTMRGLHLLSPVAGFCAFPGTRKKLGDFRITNEACKLINTWINKIIEPRYFFDVDFIELIDFCS